MPFWSSIITMDSPSTSSTAKDAMPGNLFVGSPVSLTWGICSTPLISPSRKTHISLHVGSGFFQSRPKANDSGYVFRSGTQIMILASAMYNRRQIEAILTYSAPMPFGPLNLSPAKESKSIFISLTLIGLCSAACGRYLLGERANGRRNFLRAFWIAYFAFCPRE